MTGRGLGVCSDDASPGFANPVPGRGQGMGFGRGRGGGRHGWRHRFCATTQPYLPQREEPEAAVAKPVDDVKALKEQVAQLQQTLEQIQKRIMEGASNDAGDS